MLNLTNLQPEYVEGTKINARVLADSISPAGVRIVSIEATYPRSIHSEVMTHRTFSRNAASSRAIPLSKTIRRVMLDPFLPQHWGKNQKGMQAGEELDAESIRKAERIILRLRDYAVDAVDDLEKLGVHKQLGNRYLEPWFWYQCIITSTHWLNFLHLRKNKDAEPHLQDLATAIYEAIRDSVPVLIPTGNYHLPLIQNDELRIHGHTEEMARVAAARCARVSYLTHDGVRDITKDLELYERLTQGGHLSPLEHAARPSLVDFRNMYGNLMGWKSLRYQMDGEADILAYRGEAEELTGLEGLH